MGISLAIEPITTAGVVAGLSAVWGYFDQSHCRVMECCDRYSISTDAKNITGMSKIKY